MKKYNLQAAHRYFGLFNMAWPNRAIFSSFLGLFLIFFSSIVLAERADRDKPIHLEADHATVEDYKRKGEFRTSIFTGNVVLTQGTLVLRADKVIMKEDAAGYRYATAYGDLVSYRQKRDGINEYVEAWSKRAVI